MTGSLPAIPDTSPVVYTPKAASLVSSSIPPASSQAVVVDPNPAVDLDSQDYKPVQPFVLVPDHVGQPAPPHLTNLPMTVTTVTADQKADEGAADIALRDAGPSSEDLDSQEMQALAASTSAPQMTLADASKIGVADEDENEDADYNPTNEEPEAESDDDGENEGEGAGEGDGDANGEGEGDATAT
ncbi:hypothetical protein HK101_008878 [Irineochytrium annulatum]|nr:hypothetical protein HK101_008878 [Irineochytrium annulatum]